ncbi:MAG: TIGR03936 family radical SAM-associated protein [Candidatus Omnitrophica bacterium]|nr:TIGR03936 family radical SAM-associated protein [Candidatus Omnitrophota bacterium]
MFKLNFVFSKTGMMKYISHLDLMRTFTRALRRAEIPVKISEGFNPHPKLSIKRALKLGLESENEEACVGLVRLFKPEDFKEKMQVQLPEGITIKSASYSNN